MNINRALTQAKSLLQMRLIQLQKEQQRTTFIFKRIVEPKPMPVHKPIKLADLEEDNFMYEMVEDTCFTKPNPDMQVILTEYVDGLGDWGDVVTIKSDLARNTLLPARMAVYASPDNLAEFEEERKKQDATGAVRLTPWLKRTMSYLEENPLTVTMNPGVGWTLDKTHIRVAYRLQGVTIPEDCITLPEEDITTPQEINIGITINKFHNTEVKVTIEEMGDKTVET